MTTTRIAGTAYDARHQSQVHELARIHTYATRIRHIARNAASPHVALPGADDTTVALTHVRPGHDHATPTAHRTSSTSKFHIAS